jgi:hypothetical protein
MNRGPKNNPLKMGKGGTRSINRELAAVRAEIPGSAPTMTAEQAETGTSTVPMLVSPKVLNDEIARQIAAIP